MKVVLDTNVLVSGLLQPFGPSGQIVLLVASGELTLCHDARILAEYQEVLLRDKFRFDPPDPDDEAFLEIALAGEVQCLVTGNAKHYPAEARQGIEVLTPRSFIELFRTG